MTVLRWAFIIAAAFCPNIAATGCSDGCCGCGKPGCGEQGLAAAVTYTDADGAASMRSLIAEATGPTRRPRPPPYQDWVGWEGLASSTGGKSLTMLRLKL